MADALTIIALLASVVLLFLSAVHLIRKTGKAKKFAYSFLAVFIIMLIAAAVAGPDTTEFASTNSPISDENLLVQQQEGAEIEQTPKGQTEVEKERAPESTDAAKKDTSKTSTVQSLNVTENENRAENLSVTGILKVHYIDVGQADSILIQLPGGQNILIDAGNNADSSLVVNYLKQQGVKRLDHVIGTHPHEDHIGGLDAAIKSFEIGKVYLPKVSHTTETYEDVLQAIKDKGLKVTEAKAGVNLDTGTGLEMVMLATNSTGYEDLNNYSAVLKLTYKDTSFLFTGDAGAISEEEMLAGDYDLYADVLKVGHHGSRYSSTLPFLKAVSPKYAVISVGKDNSYGHPHQETLDKLANIGVELFRTDQQGTIIATSDGRNITFDKKAAPIKERAPDLSKPQANPETADPAGSVTNAKPGSIKISDINLRTETVIITNNGGQAADLSGWRLVSEKGNQEFTFPLGMSIPPGGTLKILTGPDAKEGASAIVWTTANIWNNSGDPGFLYDAIGNLISSH